MFLMLFVYIVYSEILFVELGLDDSLVIIMDFVVLFLGDMFVVFLFMVFYGWVIGYVLLIYGMEYI